MIRNPIRKTGSQPRRATFFVLTVLLASFIATARLRADEPYARSRDYDLQHSKIALRFDQCIGGPSVFRLCCPRSAQKSASGRCLTIPGKSP